MTALSLLLLVRSESAAQELPRLFVGATFGVATLSADVRAVTTEDETRVGMYKPENGLAINGFGGIHLWQYFSLQASYLWNRNELTLISARVNPRAGGFYVNQRASAQHVIVIDGLLYFRGRDSAVRPYLGTGLCLVRFTSQTVTRSLTGQLDPPADQIASTRIALRSAVGVDLWINRHTAFRYSFSETISGNPISPHLTPRGERGLANYQNLFGFVARF